MTFYHDGHEIIIVLWFFYFVYFIFGVMFTYVHALIPDVVLFLCSV